MKTVSKKPAGTYGLLGSNSLSVPRFSGLSLAHAPLRSFFILLEMSAVFVLCQSGMLGSN